MNRISRPVFLLVCACVTITMLAGAAGVCLAEPDVETWGPGWLKKMFIDEDEAAWAIGHMAKMKAKGLITGYPGGRFNPNAPVTRVELIAAAVRLINAEDEAKARSDVTLPFSDYSYIRAYYPWAVGYLWAALSHGLLSPVSDAFRPYYPATRLWAAEVFVRALNLNTEAQSKMDSNLAFADEYSIPSDKVGYVAVVNDKGIMKGSGNMFLPNHTLTRAEMAVILDRCDDRIAPRDSDELRGTISSINEDDMEITIRTYDPDWWSESHDDGGDASYSGRVTISVMPGALVLLDKKHAEIHDLDDGYRVTVIKSGSYASVVDARSGPVPGWPGYEEDGYNTGYSRLVEGTIREVELGSYPTIRIRDDDGATRTYDVADDCDIRRAGRSADLDDLRVGERATLRIVDDEVTKVTAEEEEDADEIVYGEITSVSTSRERITVRTDDGSVRAVTVASDADITRDGDVADLGDLAVGDEVEIAIRDSEAVRVTAGEDYSGERTGTVTRIRTISTPYKIYIETDSGSSRSYEVSSSVVVYYDDMILEFEDIVEGDEVTLRLVDSKVRRVTIEDRPSSDVSGTIQSVTSDDGVYSIKIRKSDGSSVTYPVHPDASVRRGSDSLRMRDLDSGDTVTLRLEGNVVTRVTVLD